MDIDQVTKALGQAGGMTEVAQVTTFKGFRTNKEGGSDEVTVEIFDRGGSGNSQSRYRVVAIVDDGTGKLKKATGNPDSTVELAIDFLHWNELD